MSQQPPGVKVISSQIEISEYLKTFHPSLNLISDIEIDGLLRFSMKSTVKGYELYDPTKTYTDSEIISDCYKIKILFNCRINW